MADALDATKLSLTALSIGLHASPIPEPLKSAIAGIPGAVLQIIDIVETMKGNVDDARDLVLYIGQVTETVIRPLQTIPPNISHRPLEEGIDEFRHMLDAIKGKTHTILSQSRAARLLRHRSDAAKIMAMKKKVDDTIRCIQLETTFVTSYTVGQISQKQERAEIDALIDRLGTGDNGASKKPPCLPGTRQAVLARITKWIEDDNRQGFCLSGQAGTGKPFIAASIAKRESAFKRLGGVFHFIRDDQARNKGAILAIARQLAAWKSGRLRSAIASVIKDNLDIAHMTPSDQFQKLILEPLGSLNTTCPTLIIILDAIDECELEYASLLLQLIGTAFGGLPLGVKFFITSRGEPRLQYYYHKEPMKS
ncbi:hypothetical protein FRB94_006697 [Tulasnella sp. JGI-2019a]|nr:hypothetical protein FRB94_006697 [Tulasnella sp. JGI-2019a]KAG9027881.1 hypothetical protein FRB95_007079 [Tulasnella sp. JGI-2019a]